MGAKQAEATLLSTRERLAAVEDDLEQERAARLAVHGELKAARREASAAAAAAREAAIEAAREAAREAAWEAAQEAAQKAAVDLHETAREAAAALNLLREASGGLDSFGHDATSALKAREAWDSSSLFAFAQLGLFDLADPHLYHGVVLLSTKCHPWTSSRWFRNG